MKLLKIVKRDNTQNDSFKRIESLYISDEIYQILLSHYMYTGLKVVIDDVWCDCYKFKKPDHPTDINNYFSEILNNITLLRNRISKCLLLTKEINMGINKNKSREDSNKTEIQLDINLIYNLTDLEQLEKFINKLIQLYNNNETVHLVVEL